MSKHIPANAFRIVDTPAPFAAIAPDHSVKVVRSFDLPTGLFAATVALYFAFLGVMAWTFADKGLAIPMAIFSIYIAMAFGTPAMWVRMKPGHAATPLTWNRFMREGVDTLTGRLDGKGAAVQILMLPVLILGWGLIVATIVATL
ncbi:hypothetical protein L7H23_12470 [Sphingopyxis sp. BSN-002]|uniref:hypothetical protein n=1 Tax=Sphingopyxis sp. BSN-002 TaxID=2911495 RepID=UPI001EDB9340|nr:hypothetical protein [Sphingopyxis sp. BSN-002]UKK83377.1 hypothetical protein L7H23_12470 [Sphingopyxis sp. BSN-002]